MKIMKMYCDMDGVLADLDSGMFGRFGANRGNGMTDSEFFDKYLPQYTNEGGFFTQGKMPHADSLERLIINTSRYFDWEILTSHGDFYHDHKVVVQQKADWLERHYPDTLARLVLNTTESGKAKARYAHPQAFLVDDHEPNIHQFIEAGGMGFIYHPGRLNELTDYLTLEIVNHIGG